ncbi:MAG: DnaJ domain-containing protein [Bacillota bacterium]|nr:DnaJ domain-containing protein [Bacillota bacterium]
MNPYKVLGIRENSTDDEVRAAYHAMVKKYHPDQYSNNPLSELAQEKLKEINQAYEMVMNSRSGKGNADKHGSGSGYQNGGGAQYSHVRANIQSGNLDAAEAMLDAMGNRDAEWYYLKGIANMQRGWYGKARENLNHAVEMDPNNNEYRNALNQLMMSGGANPYGNLGGGRPAGNNLCNLCGGLCCADTCCECMGGDLCNCC